MGSTNMPRSKSHMALVTLEEMVAAQSRAIERLQLRVDSLIDHIGDVSGVQLSASRGGRGIVGTGRIRGVSEGGK